MENRKKTVALGFFDGVHLGHQALLRECVAMAREMNAQPAAITFAAHPKSLFTQTPPGLINTAQDRETLLRQFGMEKVYTLPVTKDVMSTDWRQFLTNLTQKGAAGFVCGNDFHFGHKGEGSAETLQAFCAEKGLPCKIVPEQTLDGVRISSTHIRGLLKAGEMEEATRFLGHPHILSGVVTSGRKLGRTMGIPTANLQIPEGLQAPKFGVYACKAEMGGKSLPAVTNIGTRPTVAGEGVTVEAWILGFDGDLYGREVKLEFHRFLRPEKKFPDLDTLRREIRKNGEETQKFFEKM